MHFKKLELFGFKSFADKTALNFEPGITTIVGPNGCGKSNVFDSIRWVLGEQSAKDLRGSSMEDVIFNGTDKKPSLGFAEVTLTFDNKSRRLEIDKDDIAITRRLYRSGESEYLINGSVCRLRDIQEMLMGTGVGAECYSLVQQGKVDMVVNAKPEERRLIVDEAAGITKYRKKKKEALSKLKSTENNLLRVNDIITEVKRQISSIERQANKARKYKAEFEKLKNLEIKIARHQMRAFEEGKAEIEADIGRLKQEENRLNAQINELNQDISRESDQLNEIEEKMNRIHSHEIKLDGQIDLNNRQIGFNEERIENIDQNKKRLIEQKEKLIEQCRNQQEKIEILKQSLKTLEETLEKNRQTLVEKKDSLSSIEKSIKEAKEKILEFEEKILGLTSKQVSVRNELTDVMKESQGALARKRRLEMELSKVTDEKAQVESKLQNVDYQINCVHGTICDLKDQKQEKVRVNKELDEQLAGVKSKIEDLEKKKLFLISQKEFIEKLHAQYQDMPDPVVDGRLVVANAPLEHHTGIIGKVKGVRDISQNETEKMYEIFCETKFIELDPQQINDKIEEITAELDHLNGSRDDIQAQIETLKQVIADLEQEIINKEKSYSILVSQKNDTTTEQEKLKEELDLVSVEISEVTATLETIKKKEDELNYELDSINSDIEWAQNDIKEKQAFINKQTQEKEQVSINIAQLETEIDSDKDKLAGQQENFKMFNETLDNWLEDIKRLEDDAGSQDSKKEHCIKENENLKVKIEEIRKEKEDLRGAISEQEFEKKEKAAVVNRLKSQLSGLDDKVDGFKQAIHGKEMEQQELLFKERALKDRLMQTYKIDYDQCLKEESERKEAAAAEAGEADEGEGQESAEEDTADDGPINLQEAQQELAKLRKRCDAYGSVNLVAIEEYEELKERFEFLTSQQSDLLEAKSQLMSTINKINRSTRQMFMDTFTKVSEEFRIYFRMLFGGGEAQLVLLDPDNVLESGIDIVARPPGKKLQNINLLSGGEKTLTAIALIFGVFKVNPSPFCVLDEIDAALDETNVGRFSYLLQDFSKIAQFIVITHNKKTISSSDIMYGITMPETGVSRVVSVKLSENEEKEAKEEAAAGV